jgi:hypothetical protein
MYSYNILIFINEASVRHLKFFEILEVGGKGHQRNPRGTRGGFS